jgi:hypothetical protein
MKEQIHYGAVAHSPTPSVVRIAASERRRKEHARCIEAMLYSMNREGMIVLLASKALFLRRSHDLTKFESTVSCML